MTTAAGDATIGLRVLHHRRTRGAHPAFLTEAETTTWAAYDGAADRVAAHLADAGLGRGDRVAVLMPDGPQVHATFVGVERIGAVVVGIGFRAGLREIDHLLTRTDAAVLVTQEGSREDVPRGLGGVRGMALPVDLGALAPGVEPPEGDPLGADELFLLNSTSGTTGLPKCVMHTQRRWLAFHPWAVEAAGLTDEEVFFSAIPTPFGFGLWTAHFTPTILGCPTVLTERFRAGPTLDLIERFGVTVLACVSTQFIMLLNEQGGETA